MGSNLSADCRDEQGELSGPFVREQQGQAALKGGASWKLSHSKAGRGSGLAHKGTVPKYLTVPQYLSRKTRAGQDEELDQQGTWPGMGMAVLAQAGIKGENLS